MYCMTSRRIYCGLLICALAGACSDGGTSPGSDGGTGAVDSQPAIPLNYDTLAEVCVRLNACGIASRVRLADCVDNYYHRSVAFGQLGLYNGLYDCANKGGGDCKVIRECLGFEGKPQSCTQDYAPKCEGDVAYNCDLIAGWEQVIDCSKGGLKCAINDGGSSRAASCGGGVCDAQTFVSTCKGNTINRCTGGAIEFTDCGSQHLQCREGMSTSCEGDGRSCAPTKPACDGNFLVDCIDGYVSKIDCGQVFGAKTCDNTGGTCKGSGTECSTDGDFDSCDGNHLVTCIDGYKKKFDCVALGFEGCVEEAFVATCKAKPVY